MICICNSLNTLSVLYLDRLAVWQSILIALGFGVVTALVIQFIVKPRLRAKIANS